jgi:ribA/ribD-fused uncharacterized protein
MEHEAVYVSRSDVTSPLAAWSKHGFELAGVCWPSVEHHYQAMKFEDPVLRDAIRVAPHPKETQKIAKKNRRKVRKDWKSLRKIHMTRAVYLKCRSHPQAARALLGTGTARIVETSQYDYFWGCGRDGRGENNYGKVLMDVRGKLRALKAS